MPLTKAQADFIERFIKIPVIFGQKAKAKRKEWEKEFGRFNVDRDAVRARVATLNDGLDKSGLMAELARIESGLLAAKGRPDFEGAHEKLTLINSAYRIQREFEDTQVVIDAAAADCQPVLQSAPYNADEITATLQSARDSAQQGASTHNAAKFEEARKTARLLPALLKEAQDQQAARNDVAGTLRELAATRDTVSKGLGGDLPRALASAFDAVGAKLEQTATLSSEAVLGVNRDARNSIALLATDPQKMSGDRSAYESALAEFEGLYRALLAHPQRAEPIFVVPLLSTIGSGADAARAKAGRFDWEAAAVELKALAPRCRDGIKLGDDIAQYQAVLKDRKDRVAALGEPSNAMEGSPRDKVAEARGYISTAESEFAAGKSDKDPARIAQATTTLANVPAAVEEAQKLLKYSKIYEDRYDNYKRDSEVHASYPEPYKTQLAPEMQLFSKILTESMITDTSAATVAAFQAAAVKLDALRKFTGLFYKKQHLIQAYVLARDACSARWNEFQALTVDDGRNAVDDYVDKLVSDYQFAEALVASPATADYAQATAVFDSTKGEYAQRKADVPLAREFRRREKAVTEKVDTIKSDTGNWARAAADAVTSIMSSAQAQSRARNWSSALALLTQAEARLSTAESVATTVKGFYDAVKDGTANDEFNSYEQLRDKVSAAAPAEFTQLIAATTTQAEQGRDEGDKSKIKAAIHECLKIGKNVGHKAQYDQVHGVVEQAHDTDLPALNNDANSCISGKITEIGKLKLKAEKLAEPGKLDFSRAVTALGVAERHIEEAKQIAEKWKAHRDKYFEVKAIRDELADGEIKAVFNDEYQRLKTYCGDAWKKIKTGEIADAIKMTDEILTYARAVKSESKYLKAFNTRMAGDHKQKRDTVAESVAAYARSARAAIARYDPEIIAFRDAKLIAQAWFHADRLEWEIDQGLAIQKAAETYFAAKQAAADALSEYEGRNSADNVKVTEKLNELNSAFGIASFFDGTSEVNSWEAEDKYTSGLRALAPIPDACARLDADIKAYDDCNAPRQTAGKAIGEILKSGNKDIQGLAQRLRGKHANAVDTMNAGDYSTARTMFEELVADAAKAVLTAGEIGSLKEQLDGVASIPEGGDLDGPISTARGKLAELRQRENSFAATTELDAGDDAVAEAEAVAATDENTARKHLETAITQASAALRQIETARQFMASASYAADFLHGLRDTHAASAFVARDIAGATTRLASLKDAVKTRTTTSSVGIEQLEVMMVDAHGIRRMADSHMEFQHEKLLADKALADMEGAEARYAIREQIQKVRIDIVKAGDLEDARRHDEAMRLLRLVTYNSAEALLAARFEVGNLPADTREVETQIKTVLDMPGGEGKLDALVSRLDPKADRGTLIAVMKVRYGCDMEVLKQSPDTVDAEYKQWLIDTNTSADGPRVTRLIELLGEAGGKGDYDSWLAANAGAAESDKKDTLEALLERLPAANDKYRDWLAETNPKSDQEKAQEKERRHAENKEDRLDEAAPNLQKMYAAMAMCPSSDTLDNDSLLVLSTSGGVQTGSAYSQGIGLDGDEVRETKKILMREGDVGDSSFYGVGLEFELDDIDDDCRPESDAEPLSMFSWNTLHEVGHAVDDKGRIMEGKGKSFADWQSHGANVLAIAQEAAKDENLGFDANYIAAYLSGTSEPPIPPVKGVSDPDGDQLAEWERKRLRAINWCDSIRVDKNPWASAEVARKIALKNGRVYHESYKGTWYSYRLDARKQGISGYQFRAPGEWFSELYAAYHAGKMKESHPYREWIASH